MKGLLQKELYCIWKCCRAVLFLIIFFTVLSLWSRENILFLLYPLLFAGTLPMTLLSYDERDHWEAFASSLPLSRAQLVSSKYLVGLGMAVLATVPLLLAQTLVNQLSGEGLFQLIQLALLLGLLPPALLLPVIFRFGVSKGRLLYYCMVGGFCGLFLALMNPEEGILPTLSQNLGLLLCLLPVVAFGLSWLLSIRLYQKRDL